MSTLIKELEARKDDYILVASVITVMAGATNSAPDEVVKYLDAHNIDEHMPLLYMDESYTFEEYNGHILGLGNDANITYFRKADVMAFEPITKHGIFGNLIQPANELGEHQKLLITYELFTPEKIACLLTDSNPLHEHSNDDYNARLDMVSNAIDASKLNYVNSKDEISAEQIKIWLKNNKIIFEGFNDDLSYLSLEQSVQVNELQKHIADLESQLLKFQRVAPDDVVIIPFSKRIDFIDKSLPQSERIKQSYELYSDNMSFHEDMKPVNTPDEMIKRIQGLLKVIKRKDSKIAELEQQVDTPANDSILQTILDDSHEYHATDLKYAIQLWHDLYIDGLIGTDSHSNKADRWINSNTSYGNYAEDSSVKRLRQVSTPLKDFGGQRKR